MKHFFVCALAALATIGMISRAEAKDPEDAESDHVIITLKSGEKVDCYVHRGWHAENSVFKKENYSFKVTKTPDDKEPIEYTADDVLSIDYVETTADHPDGLRWESHPLAKPNFASRYHTLQMLFCVDKVSKNATTYWWKIWVSSGINGMGRSLQTNFGIRFHNDPEGIVYPCLSLHVGQFGADEGSLSGVAGFLQEVVQGARGESPQKGGRGERRVDSRHV